MRVFDQGARPDRHLALLASLLLTLAGCTTPRAGGMAVAEADRWEKSNRDIYAFNKKLDKYALKPAAKAYRTTVPTAARHGITNVYNTYNEPLNFLNALLQGKIKQAFRSVDRFMINATIGVGGLADNATELGRPEEPEDWGQTFATWGFESGPYVMLPLFGPSTLRDSFGLGFDFVVHPSDIAREVAANPNIFWRAGQISLRIVNLRDRVSEQGADAMLAGSLDEYTLVKSAYLQRRRDQIWDGNAPYEPEDDDSESLPAGLQPDDVQSSDARPVDPGPFVPPPAIPAAPQRLQ
jgi:phospholipid-binding lipoprotein MlaA